MRGTTDKNYEKVKDAAFSKDNDVDLRSIELNVQGKALIEAAVHDIIAEHGHIDVLVHNAVQMMHGPLEAFTPEQLAQEYDVNVLGTHRLNRIALPHMRDAKSGLVVWVSSTSVAGGVPPLLGPYFTAKAGMDALAVCYAKELALLGIETSIVVPGAFTKGTNHSAKAGHPDDGMIADSYTPAWPDKFAGRIQDALAATVPNDADPAAVGQAVVDIVAMTPGKRALRVYVDPASDGTAVTFTAMDRVREQFLHRIGFSGPAPCRLIALLARLESTLSRL
jgi:NAD(P)-dependent dehydrogenase (short-subunit alcohol dehydrogenase family)